jgi:hypothetical protein
MRCAQGWFYDLPKKGAPVIRHQYLIYLFSEILIVWTSPIEKTGYSREESLV